MRPRTSVFIDTGRFDLRLASLHWLQRSGEVQIDPAVVRVLGMQGDIHDGANAVDEAQAGHFEAVVEGLGRALG